MKKLVLTSVLLSGVSLEAMAVEQIMNAGKAVFTGWSGDVEAGGTFSNGNTEEKEYNLNLDVQKDGEAKKWGYKFEAYAEGEETNNVTTEEEYRTLVQARYNVSDVNYMFGELTYLNDRFEGYKMRLTETLGYGHKFYNTEIFKMSGEVSLGMRQTEFTDETDENSFITKFALDASYRFAENLSFVEDLDIGVAESTSVLSESAIKVDFTKNLYGKVAYEVEYNSDVPEGTKETDTTLSFKVGYSF